MSQRSNRMKASSSSASGSRDEPSSSSSEQSKPKTKISEKAAELIERYRRHQLCAERIRLLGEQEKVREKAARVKAMMQEVQERDAKLAEDKAAINLMHRYREAKKLGQQMLDFLNERTTLEIPLSDEEYKQMKEALDLLNENCLKDQSILQVIDEVAKECESMPAEIKDRTTAEATEANEEKIRHLQSLTDRIDSMLAEIKRYRALIAKLEAAKEQQQTTQT